MTPNTLFPGRPNYTGPTKGYFGLLHHDRLFEWSDNVLERIDYVKKDKPLAEQAIRLRSMIYLDLKDLNKAYEDLDKAREDWNKAREDWNKARKDWNKAYKDWYKAYEDLAPEVLAYIKAHIPDCAWDGKELRFT